MQVYNTILKEFKNGYYFYVPTTIILQSCLGSISIFYVTQQELVSFNYAKFAICILVCMLYNASIMAQFKPKVVLNIFITSIVINVLILLSFLIYA